MKFALRRIVFIVSLLIFAVTIFYADEGEAVYFTQSGKKYHSSTSCRSLARSKNILNCSLDEAKKKGLEPCKFCYKDEGYNTNITDKKPKEKPASKKKDGKSDKK